MTGVTTFRVIDLGLVDVVTKGLNDNKGVNRLAKEINETILAGSATKISGMAILRWSKVHYVEDTKESLGQAVNVANHYDDILALLSEQIDVQRSLIDDLRKESAESMEDIMKYSKALSLCNVALEKYISKKLVLLSTISGMQDKVYSYMKATEIIEITLGTVKDEDAEMYHRIMGRLRENKEYMEMFRKIMPNK